MSFKIVIFAAAVFACQVNAQMGIVRPFGSGFASSVAEMAKPFVQLGQSFMGPIAEYLSNDHRQHASQWANYPSQFIPQVQGPVYEGYDAIASGVPGASYAQVYRPRPSVFYKPQPQPQSQYYPVPSQVNVPRPSRPYPVPAPAPAPAYIPAPAPASDSSSEESDETYVPSSLLIQPEEAEVKVPKPTSVAIEENIKIPSLQRPLPIEDKQ